MPIKPEPFTLVCHECGWSQCFKPMSDCMLAIADPDYCPKCGESQLQKRKPTWYEKTFKSQFC